MCFSSKHQYGDEEVELNIYMIPIAEDAWQEWNPEQNAVGYIIFYKNKI